jgi:hypothetical protein
MYIGGERVCLFYEVKSFSNNNGIGPGKTLREYMSSNQTGNFKCILIDFYIFKRTKIYSTFFVFST